MLDLAIVGTGGMTPLPNRWLASVLLRVNGKLVLFDCGEGTQISLRQLGWGLKDIDVILLSHLHGDHVSGLPGLLLSQGNSGRTEPITVVGPQGLARVVRGLLTVAPHLPFGVECLEGSGEESFEYEGCQVHMHPSDHSVPSLAYRFEVPRAPRFLPERAEAFGVPKEYWSVLQNGQAVQFEGGQIVVPDDVIGPPRAGIAVGFTGDTRPTPALAAFFRDVDLLVSEATYGGDADEDKALERKHMTFREAAGLARDADAGKLLLTHFSAALTSPQEFAANALEVFPETIVSHDHMTLSLRFPED